MKRKHRNAFTAEQRRYLDRQPKVCAVCHTKGLVHKFPRYGYLEKDHIKPVAEGGTNDVSNLQWLCRWHNCNKKSKVSKTITAAEMFMFHVIREAVNG